MVVISNGHTACRFPPTATALLTVLILGYAPGRMPEKWAIQHSRLLFGLDNGFAPWGKDLRQGGAVLGLWKQQGTVVSVGCTEWARHLGDARVAQITRNIVTHLSD